MARKRSDGFREKQRVKAARDLPGVPTGTPGRVFMVVGITWRRYRVDFDNGETVNMVDDADLVAA